MNGFDWSPYLVGGGTRPDAMTGLAPDFASSLAAMFSAAPPDVLSGLRVTSGYRSPEVQAGLWDAALAKYGSPEAARKWVAPPGRSHHNAGGAVDLKYLSPIAQQWAHDNAAQYGLQFPLSNEPWHIEPLGSRGGASPVSQTFGTAPPALAGMFSLGTPLEPPTLAPSLPWGQQAAESVRAKAEDAQQRKQALADLITY